jgi:hypothetical protein
MINYNTAKTQRNFDPIHDGIYLLQAAINPGGDGPDGWLTPSKDGASLGLNVEYTVAEGEHAGRKIFERLTISGTTEGHEKAAEISAQKIRAILESARGVRPDDMSEAAIQARSINSYEELCGLRFLGKIGVQPPQNGYEAKNTLRRVAVPGMPAWHPIAQDKASSAAPVNSYAEASAARTHEPPAPPATLVKPGWAE